MKNNYAFFKIKQFLLVGILFFISINNNFAGEYDSYISLKKSEGCFTLAESVMVPPLFTSSQDHAGVLKVLNLFRNDINNVTGNEAIISEDVIPPADEIIIVGSIDKSPIIANLVEEGKLDITSVKGKWEAFLIQIVDNPYPGVKRALVIAGSDKRGTIYGMFDVSKAIGVSPWYWWADVAVKKKENIYIKPGVYLSSEPKVKYRGIFINDEAPALSGWSMEKYGTVQFNHKLYEHVFELILRLKGNFLWPAMWGRSFYDDDPMNPVLAEEYGIVISTSHHEPMMRAHVEWERYGSGDWNYATNEENLREFWKKGIKRMGDNESVVTLAMRGDGDEAMSEGANIDLLQKIVNDQREIISEVTGKPLTETPQVWALYKEVQEYYDKGMRVPDDVTLLLCDDNWGNIRKLPLLDKEREGGYGIYYHYDYVGGPRNYKWINTTQIERVWEQMHLAYEYGANRIWIVNVGDIKPMEFPIDFILDYAWNPEAISAEQLPDYYTNWAGEQFGEKYAEEIGDIIAKYSKYNSRRKPELLSPGTYSLANYNEAERIVNKYTALAEKAQKIYDSIHKESKDAYYQLVLHPVIASANLNELYVAAAKNHLYAEQERAATNDFAEKVKALFKKDAEITDYYNNELAGGKWKHMMDQTHIGYTNWQQPDENNMPEVVEISIPENAGMGVAIEGSIKSWPGSSDEAVLPEFDPYNRQSYYVEIFNKGKSSFDYSVSTGEPWIQLNSKEGTVDKQERIYVSVDWENAPSGKHKVPVTINGTGESVIVYAEINNPASPESNKLDGFVESNGYVSIEAVHYSKAVESNSVEWLDVPNLGRTCSAVTAVPVTASEQTPGGNSPHLEYNIYFQSEGEVEVEVFLSPTLNFHNKENGIRFAVSFDDEQPQIINMSYNPDPPNLNRDGVWNGWVANNINRIISKYNIDKPGKHILKFWMVDPAVVLQKIIINTGGLKPTYLGPPESFNNEIKNNSGE